MQTAVSSPVGFQEKILNKLLLVCGILSSLWYLSINIIVPIQDPGYNVVSQTVSELSAIGSPTRVLWNLLSPFYSLLIIPFGWGIWISSGRNRKLQVAAVMILIYGFSGFFWPPMHLREDLAAGELHGGSGDGRRRVARRDGCYACGDHERGDSGDARLGHVHADVRSGWRIGWRPGRRRWRRCQRELVTQSLMRAGRSPG